MPAKAVYASKVLAIYISRESLDELIEQKDLTVNLALGDVNWIYDGVEVVLNTTCSAFLRDLVDSDRQALKEQMHLVQNSTPGYSNRKIRKGKGHGKG